MSERVTAEERLERILYLLPAAAGEEGAPLEALAADLGVDVPTLLAEVEAVTERSFYHPPASADDLQITVTPERLRVWSAGPFKRPPRLSPREALSVAIGLRLAALEAARTAPDPGLPLQRRLERLLAMGSAEPHERLIDAPDLHLPEDAPHAALLEAAETRRACRIVYLKPDAPAPEARTVEPYVLACAEGAWYAIGRSVEADGVRVFRLDRVLEAQVDGAPFEVPADFDPARWVSGGRVFHAEAALEARVRYSPRVARWIEEQGEVERTADGSVIARHTAATPAWLVRHVLRYGADAEVLEPPELRRRVREAALAMAAAVSG